MKERHTNVAIIGGGASGLAAAVELGMSLPELDVLVIEKMDSPGHKLRATGSGRCNITNTCAEGYTEIMKFFARIGLVTRAYENGLVYPYSESASDVVKLLTDRAEALGVRVCCGEEVTAVRKEAGKPGDGKPGFRIESMRKGKVPEHIITEADNVILAVGGKAGPSYGTTGDGYRIARELGHSIVTPVPVLTSVECEEWSGSVVPNAVRMAGTRTRGVVSLYRQNKEVFSEPGEIQFTKYGLSGICVFNMTRYMRFNRAAGESLADYTITADLFPDGDIRSFLKERRKNSFRGETADSVLRTILKENIAGYAIETAGSGLLSEKAVQDLDDVDIDAISDAVHAMTFHPTALKGWRDAQATSGGVALDELNEQTCESKLLPGLYITGELADRDFQCGGYNLSNAWLTGLAAARAIGKKNG